MPNDKVNHPSHYTAGGIECIDAMQSMMHNVPIKPLAAYAWGNCFKYIWRWPWKNGVEDLRKARWYLDKLIQEVEGLG
jgi:hypothetical protein